MRKSGEHIGAIMAEESKSDGQERGSTVLFSPIGCRRGRKSDRPWNGAREVGGKDACSNDRCQCNDIYCRMFSNPTNNGHHRRRPSQIRAASPIRPPARHGVSVSPVKALQRRSVAVPAKTDRESDDELRPPSGRRLRRGERSIATLRPVAAHRECNSRQCFLFVGIPIALVVLLMARSWTSAEVDKPRQETAGIGIKEVTPPRETVTVASPKATSSEDECWIYMHMHDTGIGGDDVRSILLDNWRGKDLLFDIVQWRKGDEYAADLMASRWNVAHGGCTEALRRHAHGTCKWFTVFRHPIARLVSAFYHCRESPGDPLCASEGAGAGGMDLVHFAEHWGNYALRQFALAGVSSGAVKEWASSAGRNTNLSSWYLLKEYLDRGKVAGDAPEAALDGILSPVQGILKSRYAAVGIAEELGATVKLFQKALAMPGLDWPRELAKRGKADNTREAVDDGEYEATLRQAMANPQIGNFLRLDILLYEHAIEIFRQQGLSYGSEDMPAQIGAM